MVKLKGPILSSDASGSLADAITHANWRGRHTVRKKTAPRNPRSPLQSGGRAMMAFLCKEWAAFPPATKAQWQTLATDDQASPYTAYLSQNLKWWQSLLAPSQTYPTTRVAWWGWWNLNPTATWVSNQVRVYGRLATANANWGVMIFASPTPAFTTHPGNAILIPPLTDNLPHFWFWTPPERRTWYLNTRRFSADGYIAPADAEQSAVP